MTDQEINKAVARKLGWTLNSHLGWMSSSTQYRKPDDVICQKPNPPDYCHSIGAAWEIITHIRKKDFNTKKMFIAHLTYFMPARAEGIEATPLWQFLYEFDLMAICLAFLKLNDPTL